MGCLTIILTSFQDLVLIHLVLSPKAHININLLNHTIIIKLLNLKYHLLLGRNGNQTHNIKISNQKFLKIMPIFVKHLMLEQILVFNKKLLSMGKILKKNPNKKQFSILTLDKHFIPKYHLPNQII